MTTFLHGATGVDGVAGPAGAKGEPGPAGTNGTNGAPGSAGASAYPFTFSFTTTTGFTYACTLPAANTPGTCHETPAPTPTTGG